MLFTKRMSMLLALCLVMVLGCEPPKPQVATTGGDAVAVHRVDIKTDEANRPTLYINLPDSCSVPDGTTLDDATGIIYLNVPNYAPRDEKTGAKKNPPLLMQFDKNAKLEELLNYDKKALHPVSKEVGPMGMDIGPDGHIYVADNQYFCSDGKKGMGSINSRVLRVLRKDGKVTGDVEVVIDGIKLANALVWHEDVMYVTDTQIKAASDSPETVFGEGGIWRFTSEEILGKKDIKVDATVKGGVPADKHLAIVLPVKKIGRGDNSGADGATWAWGALYMGNFGDGVMFRVEFDKDGKATSKVVLDDPTVHCCDGIFYDAATDLIYIDDSQANAIRTLDKNHKHGWLWMNDDTNGDGGLLDQPAECIVRGDELYVVNFDWPFPGLKNTANDKPHTISMIKLHPKTLMEKVTDTAVATGAAVMDKALDGAEAVTEKVKETAPVVIEKVTEGAKEAAGAVGDAAETAIEKVKEATGFTEEKKEDAVKDTKVAPAKAGEAELIVGEAAEDVTEAAEAVKEDAKDAVRAVEKEAPVATEKTEAVVGEAAEDVTEAAEAVGEGAKDAVEDVKEKVAPKAPAKEEAPAAAEETPVVEEEAVVEEVTEEAPAPAEKKPATEEKAAEEKPVEEAPVEEAPVA